MPRAVRSMSRPSALVKVALPSAIMRTLLSHFWLLPHAPMTNASLTATHHTSSTFLALSLSCCATYPGTCFADHVGVNAPGKPKITIFFPLVSSATLNALGPTVQPGRSSVTSSVSVPSGSRSPTLMAIAFSFRCGRAAAAPKPITSWATIAARRRRDGGGGVRHFRSPRSRRRADRRAVRAAPAARGGRRRRRLPHVPRGRAPRHAARHGALAGRVPGRRRSAHAPAALRSARLPAAALHAAAADRGDLHARPAERRPLRAARGAPGVPALVREPHAPVAAVQHGAAALRRHARSRHRERHGRGRLARHGPRGGGAPPRGHRVQLFRRPLRVRQHAGRRRGPLARPLRARGHPALQPLRLRVLGGVAPRALSSLTVSRAVLLLLVLVAAGCATAVPPPSP